MGKRKALLKRRASNDPSMDELNASSIQDEVTPDSLALSFLLVTSKHRLVQFEGEEREHQSCHLIVTVPFHNFQIKGSFFLLQLIFFLN